MIMVKLEPFKDRTTLMIWLYYVDNDIVEKFCFAPKTYKEYNQKKIKT